MAVDTVLSEEVLICSAIRLRQKFSMLLTLPSATSFVYYSREEKRQKVEVFCELSTP
jgi:hypothetical protein